MTTPARRRALQEVADAGPEGLGFGTIALHFRRKLEADGLIEQVGIPAPFQPIRHRLTDAGRKALKP